MNGHDLDLETQPAQNHSEVASRKATDAFALVARLGVLRQKCMGARQGGLDRVRLGIWD
jgi:hypothetical protein